MKYKKNISLPAVENYKLSSSQYLSFNKLFDEQNSNRYSLQQIIDSSKLIVLDKEHNLHIEGWELISPKYAPDYYTKRNLTYDSELWLNLSFSGPLSDNKEIAIKKCIAKIPTPTEDSEFIISSNRSRSNRYSMTMQLVLSPGIYISPKKNTPPSQARCRIIPAIGAPISFMISAIKEPGQLKAIKSKLENIDMSTLGKRQMTSVLGLHGVMDTENAKLTSTDVNAVSEKLLQGPYVKTDDRTLKNRKVKLIGDFLSEIFDECFKGLHKIINERWQIERPRGKSILCKEDLDFLIPHDFVQKNYIDRFFKQCELFQLLDDLNPVAQISQKRRLTFRGPGGLPENALLLDKRDVHPTDFGRLCPVECPQGEDLGLTLYLARDARINAQGLLEAHFINQETNEEVFLDPYEEEALDIKVSVPGYSGFISGQQFAKTLKSEIADIEKKEVTHTCYSSASILGLTASLIPFFQHNDANRALMGANMLKQALPLVNPEPPIVQTGFEKIFIDKLTKDNPFVANGQLCLGRNLLVGYLPWDLLTYEDAVVISQRLVDEQLLTHKVEEDIYINEEKNSEYWDVITLDNEYLYDSMGLLTEGAKYLDQDGVIKIGSPIEPSTVLISKLRFYGMSLFFTDDEFNRKEKQKMLFERINEDIARFEESKTKDRFKKGIKNLHDLNKLISQPYLHMLYLKLTQPEITHLLETLMQQVASFRTKEFSKLNKFKQRLVLRLNRYILESIYESAVPPLDLKVNSNSTASDVNNLMLFMFPQEEYSQDAKNASLYAPQGMEGVVKEVEWIKDGLPHNIKRRVRIRIQIKTPVKVGDKLTGRHGNKGVVSAILPEREMPYFKSTERLCRDTKCPVSEEHTHLEIMLNPLTITSRMNLGQLYETTLGWLISNDRSHSCIAAPFSSDWTWENIEKALKEKGLTDKQALYYYENGKEVPIGMSSEGQRPVTVGYQYFLKLKHLAEQKLRVRSEMDINPTLKQPVAPAIPENPDAEDIWKYRQDRKMTPQRLGEMEVWALEGHSAWNILDELLSLKSDAESLHHLRFLNTLDFKKLQEEAFKTIKDNCKIKNWKFTENTEKPDELCVICSEETSKDLEGFALELGLKINKTGDDTYHLSYAPLDVFERDHGAFKAFIWYCRAIGLEVEGVDQNNRPVKLVGEGSNIWPRLKGVSIRIASDAERKSWVKNHQSKEGLTDTGATGVNSLWSDALGDPFAQGKDIAQRQEADVRAAIIKLIVPIDNPLFRDCIEELLDDEWKKSNSMSDINPRDLYKCFQSLDLKTTLAKLENEEKKTNKDIKKIALIKILIKSGITPKDFFIQHLLVPPKNFRWERNGRNFKTKYPLYENDLNVLYRDIIIQNQHIRDTEDLSEDILNDMEKRLRRSVYALLVNDKIPVMERPAEHKGRVRASILSRISGYSSGKEGIFRAHLLGKRVNYSGRGVITPDPTLGLDETGLPFEIGKGLFRDLLTDLCLQSKHLIPADLRHYERIRWAKAYVLDDRNNDQIQKWLNEISKEYRVILNRAPSLHRLSMLAFYPRFEKGKDSQVIRLNPYVCSAFNADFDGDTMAVHAPILPEAQMETKRMLPSRILRSPGHGRLIIDYKKELALAYNILKQGNADDLYGEFDEAIRNGSDQLCDLVNDLTGKFREVLKQSGLTLGVSDFILDRNIGNKIAASWQSFCEKSKTLEEQEKIQFWIDETEKIKKSLRSCVSGNPDGLLNRIDCSGAGKVDITQIAGIRGIMLRPGGAYVSSPVLSNIVYGMTPLDYFVSCHGSRHGLSDKGLMTGPAGDLTNILVQAAQNQYILEEDCGTADGIWFSAFSDPEGGEIPLPRRILGRYLVEEISLSGKVIPAGTLIDDNVAADIADAKLEWIKLRSPITCESKHKEYTGVCQKCYGLDLSTGNVPPIGHPVGIIAAQSIGEPGTQLTLRTFHTGGIAGQGISQGLDSARKAFSRGIIHEGIKSLLAGKATIVESPNHFNWVMIENNDAGNPCNQWFPIFKNNSRVEAQQIVKRGDQIIAAEEDIQTINLQALFKEKGMYATAEYLMYALQKIYTKNRQIVVADHHFELVLHTMFLRLGSEWNFRSLLQVALDSEGFLSRIGFRDIKDNLARASIECEKDYLYGMKEKIVAGQIKYHQRG